jgi:ribonuclease Z
MTLKIITLGTGAGRPTLHRGASAVALVSDTHWSLFDCGEGTQLQINRAGLRVTRLATICISHLHGDHINGLPGLLGSMALDGRTSPLTLIGPPALSEYLATLKRLNICHPGFPIELINAQQQPEVSFPDLGASLLAAPLKHRIQTFGYRWEQQPRPGRFDVEAAVALGVPQGPLFGRLQRGEPITLSDGRVVSPEMVLGPPRPGKVVAYCSDTSTPCDGVRALGRDADLLIHEGTYGPGHEALAVRYGHSTVTQAAEVAASLNAKRLLLTHLSPKHATEVATLLAAARQLFPACDIARDLETYLV